MKWTKLGCIYKPSAYLNHPQLTSHASNPLAVHLQGSIFRILYSGRDIKNRSSVGFFDFDLDSFKIVNRCYAPLFTYGPPGSFYDAGVSVGCLYKCNDLTYILFMGWQSPKGEHWRGDIGRLELTQDFKLVLSPQIPFLSKSPTDPISLSYPWIYGDQNSGFHMLYGSTYSWNAINGEMIHVLHEAFSYDGHHWAPQGLAIPYQINIAQAFSRPTVYIDKSAKQHLWFSYRSGTGTPYRIGYAFREKNQNAWSLNLTNAGIDVSKHGWDSEMIEYPFVFEHKNVVHMLYNGNSYGQTGIGLAVLEE